MKKLVLGIALTLMVGQVQTQYASVYHAGKELGDAFAMEFKEIASTFSARSIYGDKLSEIATDLHLWHFFYEELHTLNLSDDLVFNNIITTAFLGLKDRIFFQINPTPMSLEDKRKIKDKYHDLAKAFPRIITAMKKLGKEIAQEYNRQCSKSACNMMRRLIKAKIAFLGYNNGNDLDIAFLPMLQEIAANLKKKKES